MGILDALGIGKAVADTATNLANGAANIVTAAKTDPALEVHAEVEKLRIEAESQLDQMVQKSIDEARKWSVQYEGAASDIQPWLKVVRNLIRPAFSILFLFSFGTVTVIDFVNYARDIGEPWALLAALPQPYWWVFGIVLTFWFGGKVAERVVQQRNNG